MFQGSAVSNETALPNGEQKKTARSECFERFEVWLPN